MSKIWFPALHRLRHRGGLPEEVPWSMKRGTGTSMVGWRRKGKASWKRQRGLSIEKDIPMGGHSRQHCEKRINSPGQAGKLRAAGCEVEAGVGVSGQ